MSTATTKIPNRFSGHGRKQWDEMITNCPWFDYDKHYVIALDDDSGNLWELIGVCATERETKRILRIAYKRCPKDLQPSLMRGGRCISFVL